MMQLLEITGAKTSFENGTVYVDTNDVNNPEAPYDLVKTMRASFYVLGPLYQDLVKFKSLCQVDVHGDLGRLIII